MSLITPSVAYQPLAVLMRHKRLARKEVMARLFSQMSDIPTSLMPSGSILTDKCLAC